MLPKVQSVILLDVVVREQEEERDKFRERGKAQERESVCLKGRERERRDK